MWIAEGYATALTIHHLTGEAVMVAFSAVNFLSLASVAHNKYPGYQLIIAADRDLNGSGQNRAEAAAKACQCDIVLPPVFGDWNDALAHYGPFPAPRCTVFLRKNCLTGGNIKVNCSAAAKSGTSSDRFS